MTWRENTIAVSLSGGLDSAVAAALLKAQGWTVWGIHLRLSGGEPVTPDLAKLADTLGIEIVELDLAEEFARQVIDYFVKEYHLGRTPNPCVQCNAAIKFGRLWEIVQGWGIRYLATGHYVRTVRLPSGEMALFQGLDSAKDQSYFVHRLKRAILPHVKFPLGELTKTQAHACAHELGLGSLLRQPESQEICFINQGNYLEFLQSHGAVPSPGDIVDRQGRVLGKHRGFESYTVGQRRGLGLSAAKPLYVVEICPEMNRIVVGPRVELFAAGLVAEQINWLIDPHGRALTSVARIRHRHPGVTATIIPLADDRAEVIFAQPQAAVTPGQAVVFYDGDRVLGGGWIERRLT